MGQLNDKTIIDAWHQNAAPWIAAINQGRIESRRLVTNQAIIDTVTSLGLKTALDVGCGEGWLVRKLSAAGMRVSGLDVVPELLAMARSCGPEPYYLIGYEELSVGHLGDPYEVLVCNFSLLGNRSVDHVFNAVPVLLDEGGYFVLQTLHPDFQGGGELYEDGWREGSWAGIDGDFADPAPWYFRTTESWIRLFEGAGLELVEWKEPVNPETGAVASLLMVGRWVR